MDGTRIKHGSLVWRCVVGFGYVAGMNKALRYVMRYFGVFLLLVLVCGCVRTVSKDGLDERRMENAALSVPDQTYYIGSEGGYDYFVIRKGSGGATHRYRVRKSQEAVNNRFSRTQNEKDWREYGSELVVTNSGGIGR